MGYEDHRSLLPDKDSDQWQGATQRYKCTVRHCEQTVLLAEHPTEGPIEINAPCKKHGKTRHVAEGRIPRTGRPLCGHRLLSDIEAEADDDDEVDD